MNRIKRIIASLLAAAMLAAPAAAMAQTYSEQIAETDNGITIEDAPSVDSAAEGFDYSQNFKNYQTLAKYIEEFYVDDSITAEEAMERGISNYVDGDREKLWGLLKAMFQSLDPWSDFYTPSEYQEFENGVNRTFYGIGVTITENDGYVEITGFSEENSFAEKSGFMVGDKFVKVSGVDCYGKTLSEVRSLIVGDLGTTVDITVLRNGELVDLVGTRVQVHTATATSLVLPDNIGYLRIISFGDTTPAEVAEILDGFKEAGITKYILDLRNNGGGRLEAAVEIAQMMIPKGKIIDVVYRDESLNQSYYSERTTKDFEMLTLVNNNTASAAEVLSSSIQDSGAGRLVGETTYGKAAIQQVFPLMNSTYFKLTVGEYKTRNGNSINYVGIEPDEYIKNSYEPIDATKFSKFDFINPASLGDYSKNVMAAKEKLGILGYYNGSADSQVFTAELKEAISRFQGRHELASSGVLDIPTQVKIEEAFEDIKIEVDLQLERAYEMLGGDIENLKVNEE